MSMIEEVKIVRCILDTERSCYTNTINARLQKIKALKEQVWKKQQVDTNVCAVCLDEPRIHVFVPCGHFVLGFARLEEKNTLAACPIYRHRIENIVKVFT